jgi:hypothetical protein
MKKRVIHLRPNKFVRILVKLSFQLVLLAGAGLFYYCAVTAPVSIWWKILAIPFAALSSIIVWSLVVSPWKQKRKPKQGQ